MINIHTGNYTNTLRRDELLESNFFYLGKTGINFTEQKI